MRHTWLSFWRFISVSEAAALYCCIDTWASISKQEFFGEHRQSNPEVVTMKPSASISLAERLGQTLGRACRGYLRQERKVNAWLIGHGVPAGAATLLFWGIKLAVLGALLYSAFWGALVAVSVIAAVCVGRVSRDIDTGLDPAEWRLGSAGYGLYTSDGHRIDPHDPEAEQ